MSRLLCLFGFHRWRAGVVSLVADGGLVSARYCERCRLFARRP